MIWALGAATPRVDARPVAAGTEATTGAFSLARAVGTKAAAGGDGLCVAASRPASNWEAGLFTDAGNARSEGAEDAEAGVVEGGSGHEHGDSVH